MAQHSDSLRAGLIFRGSKHTSNLRLYAQQRKQARRNAPAFEPLRIAHTREVEITVRDRGHAAEDAVLIPPVNVIRGGWSIAWITMAARVFPHHHELFRRLVR